MTYMSSLKLINLKISHISDELCRGTIKNIQIYSFLVGILRDNLISEFENGIKNKNLYQCLVRHKKDKKNIGVIKIGPIDKVHMKLTYGIYR